MNETIELIRNRRSVRSYQDRPIERDDIDLILDAAMRAPTAGNMMLYSIIEIEDQSIKDKLALSCDNQPFIAKAPLVLLFLADYQRWLDFFLFSDVDSYCRAEGRSMRYPGEGDMLLACCDALIAAQTAVIAAESLGIGSCYIGDIMEHYEYHQELLALPQYAFPVALVCFGYPTAAAAARKLTPRFPREIIHSKNSYQRLDDSALKELFESRDSGRYYGNTTNLGQSYYARKFSADFSNEMTRSVAAAIKAWSAQSHR